MELREVDIVGGGLAGLSAAAALARLGVRARVFERKTYPCVKLCGEFLSSEGLAALMRLARMSRQEILRDVRSRELKRFSWHGRDGRRLRLELKPAGWAVRRDRLDPWLAAKAEALGAEVCFGREGAPDSLRPQLWATGKEQPGLKSRFFAVKGYATDGGWDALHGDDIALYQLKGGYIGFTRMFDGELSYCALLDRDRVEPSWRFTRWSELAEGVFASNRELAGWSAKAGALLEGHVGAARFDFETRPAVRGGRWFVGDAVQLVPPFVGDGMAMALEGGELAAQALFRGYNDGEYERAWRARFLPRVRVARAIHPLLWLEAAHGPVLRTLAFWPGAARWIYSSTRGYAT